MQSEDYDFLHQLEANFWWFVGMREITRALFDSTDAFARCGRVDGNAPSRRCRVLDAGCGTGGMLAWLAHYAPGAEVTGLDFVTDALNYARGDGHMRLVRASATHLPFADAAFDVVTSFDVLVQLPGARDAECALDEMCRVLRVGGHGFVRVAAYEWMRSGHDQALGTHRRFQLAEMRRMMEAAGFEIIRATYANTLLLPAAILRRLVLKPLKLVDAGSDVKPLAPALQPLDRLFARALCSEARFLARPKASLPAGLSVICIGRKLAR